MFSPSARGDVSSPYIALKAWMFRFLCYRGRKQECGKGLFLVSALCRKDLMMMIDVFCFHTSFEMLFSQRLNLEILVSPICDHRESFLECKKICHR